MTTETLDPVAVSELVDRDGEDERRPLLLLWLVAASLVSLGLIPAAFTYAYGGLPAHPLLVHIPVVFAPVSAILGIVMALRPNWLRRHEGLVAVIAVVALIGTILTAATGGALEHALHFDGPLTSMPAAQRAQAELVRSHQSAGESLRMFEVIQTFALLVLMLSMSVRRGLRSWRRLDPILRDGRVHGLARALVVLGGLACLVFVIRAGHLGAKAAWYDRLHGPQAAAQTAP